MTDIILKEIMELKADKVLLIRDAKTESELKVNLLKCNRIDLLLLPLYYAWEHILCNDSFLIETYLQRTYRLYQKNVETLTNELISMLTDMYTNFLIDKKKADTLYEIYNNVILFIQHNNGKINS